MSSRQSADEMDEARQQNAAYEYLCRLEEAKIWMEAVLKETLPPSTELEENLRNGVYLAKLGNFIAPGIVPLSRIYDIFQNRYKNVGVQFRHTDNINCWIQALKAINFPEMFLVETTDVYDKKNMPKVIYCIHALSAHLFRLGQAPSIQDLYGKVQFSKQEIDSVCNEMKEKGYMIPAFQKIGGLLSGQFTNDVVSLFSDIVNINKAIDDQSVEDLLKALNKPSVGLVQVIPQYVKQYLNIFKMAKDVKVQAAQNRSLNKTYEPDIYDELLNQSEIQGYIRKVNIDCVWEDILESIKNKKRENLREIIMSSFAEIKDFNSQNIEYYVDEALLLNLNQIKSFKSRDTIQNIIRNGNRNSKEHSRVVDAVKKVKTAIQSKNKEALLTSLRAPALKLSSQISDFAAPLYLEELEADLKMSGDITYKDIKSSITVLNGIAKITLAVDSRDCEAIWRSLSNPDIPFMNIDPTLKTQYFKSLYACRQQKLKQEEENRLLTYVDIQECLDLTNAEDFQQTRALLYLEEINDSVKTSNLSTLKSAMEGLVPGEISNVNLPLCMILLKRCVAQKKNNTGEDLWLEDVKCVVKESQDLYKKALKIHQVLFEKVKANSVGENVLKSIENCESPRKCISGTKRTQEKNVCSPDHWLFYRIDADIKLYINLAKNIIRWSKPSENSGEKLYFSSVDDLQLSRNNSSNSLSKIIFNKKNEFSMYQIVRLQASIRGFLIRRRTKKILDAVIVIQKWWRNVRKKRNEQVAQKKIPYDIEYYQKNVDKIIKIQAHWRGFVFRKNFSLKSKRSESPCNPSFQLLKNLALSNQIRSHDYSIDLKVQSMKSWVVETIKRNQELALRLEEIDIKIGLLVQNRMSVEAIVAENKNLQIPRNSGDESRGIKALSKETKNLLDGYQKLFYLLQTNPAYLTRLIVHLPTRSNDLIQNCVLSLFNYGSNSRDAYLLLRLFRSALFEEVQYKFQKPVDAVTGNPRVLRLAVAFARQAEGHNPLRNILGFLIEKVLNDKTFIDTNPVDIYRRWINQMETQSGRCSELPQTVTQEEALQHQEVVDRLNHNLRILKSWVKCFLDRLSHCVNQFPYALRFIAKLLTNALLQKFPQTPEKDILKIVGNLVYYQYINSAIVAPDAFYIISLPPDQHLKIEQRRNLASIAKILHFAATKKGFGEESMHLMCLNPFIVECHEEMKKFCRSCCSVPDLEDHFRVTKYSEATLIDKPRIYITLEEIRECQKLLLEVKHEVAPDPMDPVHEILNDLGPLPSLSTLIGCSDSSEGTLSRAGKIQVCLELDNKFQSPPENPTEAEKLFIKTKELITSSLNNLHGDTLAMAIQDPKHADIAANLSKLEMAGLVKSSDDYEDILKSLIKDISNEQEYRKLQNQEINTLRTAQRRLSEKRKFYEDQLSYYEQYLKTCLSNLTAPNKKAKHKKVLSVKYSGTRLREKGVLIALDGVPPGQLKNVQFEISTTDFSGIYSVQGRFMGIVVERIDIDIQELLKLQFEGRRVMDLFGKAQINVNLLLHLLNKKFHGRH